MPQYPYYNEPGYERYQGTPEGDRNQRVAPNGGYERLRVASIQWAMVDQLKNPPPGFEVKAAAVPVSESLHTDAPLCTRLLVVQKHVKEHFRLKRAHIRKVVKGWLEEARESDTKGHFEALKKQADKLEIELEKLGPSPADAYEVAEEPAPAPAPATPAVNEEHVR